MARGKVIRQKISKRDMPKARAGLDLAMRDGLQPAAQNSPE